MGSRHSHLSFRCLKSTIKTLEPNKKNVLNNRESRTPFDNVVLVYLFLSFNFSYVSYLVVGFFSLTLNMQMTSSVCLVVIGNNIKRSDNTLKSIENHTMFSSLSTFSFLSQCFQGALFFHTKLTKSRETDIWESQYWHLVIGKTITVFEITRLNLRDNIILCKKKNLQTQDENCLIWVFYGGILKRLLSYLKSVPLNFSKFEVCSFTWVFLSSNLKKLLSCLKSTPSNL